MYKAKFKEGKFHLYLQNKEIGLISPDATWVKEGDEFHEEEIMEFVMGDNYYMGVSIKHPKTGEWM